MANLNGLKQKAWKANIDLVKHGLVIFTWGNVSAIDRENSLVAIKPSGIDYSKLTPRDMVVLNLKGELIEGDYRPSSDTPTHIALYKAFPEIGGIVHTHSTYATAWAQAGKPIPAYGTTHADYFYGEIPCTRTLSKEEIEADYELNTGLVIIEKFAEINPVSTPGVIVHGHAPFAWGKNADIAVHNAVVLEQVAQMALITESLGGKEPIPQFLLDKHFNRKHGKNSYYGN
jgi:L-ribulose-5-phosphate 4-epimerase